jgi:hypothetical protein
MYDKLGIEDGLTLNFTILQANFLSNDILEWNTLGNTCNLLETELIFKKTFKVISDEI